MTAFQPPPPTHWYVDYPDVQELDGRTIEERLFETQTEAEEYAVGLYRNSDVDKIVVCEYPSLRRVATVYGDRTTPGVKRRR